ncbi:MAG: hypothetical protein FJ255_09510 [Phycisphaerae bacterium]|nr:hypothetical protein [Phycisphaerae bacterium]
MLTDGAYPSQFLFWMPAAAVAVVGAGLVAASRAIAPRAARGRVAARRTRWLAALSLLAVVVHATAEGRLLADGPPAPTGPTLRVVYWNPSWGSTPGLEEEVRLSGADVFVIGDQPTDVPWQRVRSHLGERGSALWAMNSVVLSRHPLVRWGCTSLEIDGAWEQARTNPDGSPRITRQRGRAVWIEVETTEAFGRPIVMWLIDLPSDPLLDRAYVGRRADEAIRSWRGPSYRRSPEGRDVPEEQSHAGFPEPDLIVGDFNTHRGAASIARLTRGLPSAFGAAGRGLLGTFPRELPLWHLDQAFVGPGVRLVGYRLRDPGEGRHWMQIIDLECAGSEYSPVRKTRRGPVSRPPPLAVEQRRGQPGAEVSISSRRCRG